MLRASPRHTRSPPTPDTHTLSIRHAHVRLTCLHALRPHQPACSPSRPYTPQGSTKTDNVEVFTYARSQLLKLYAGRPGPMGKMVDGLLAALAE